jgi:lysophospholipase L1-like esterase
MNEKPRVLLLGDSIRMSYQQRVAERLGDRATVVGPAENCQFSLYTLSSLPRWLAALGCPAVVHWNNGIHDVGHNPNRRPVQFSCEDYVGNLGLILRQLRETGARVVWATMTPVHPLRELRDDQWSWRNTEIDEYNLAARELMAAEGVSINDLHALVASDMDRFLAEDMLHLSEAGCEACAAAVAQAVESCLDDA